MDYSFFQQQINTYPSVYKIQLDHTIELLALYSNVILPNTPVCKVESQLAEYVTSGIEPTGWKAIWRASPRISGLSFKCDFLVNVIDVMQHCLDAVLMIEQPLSVQLDELDENDESKKEINRLIKEQRIINAPVHELYIINEDDKEEMFLKSAIIVEHVRFFMKFIWRPWDTIVHETQLDEIFVETRLEPRLNLYSDIQNCILSKSQIKRIKQLLSEGWKLRDQLDDIVKRQEIKSPIDDGEETSAIKNDEYEIDELDMCEAIRLKIKLEDYEREMRMLEDPYLRPFTFYLKVDANEDSEKEPVDCEVENGEKMEIQSPIVHVVSKSINLNSFQLINSHYSKNDTCCDPQFKFYESLKDAIRAAKNGHQIAILPGHYTYENIPWIECDLHFEGLSSSNEQEIVIESSAFIDVFIHCLNNLTLNNLTLKCPNRDLVINSDFDSFRSLKLRELKTT